MDFSITCNFEGSWEEMLRHLSQELYIHTHMCMHYVYSLCLYALKLYFDTMHCQLALTLLSLDLSGEKTISAT